MKRFYEVSEPEKLAFECRRIWGLPDGVNIGPVNTNFLYAMFYLHVEVNLRSR